jgi:hypothetical protein
MIVGNDRQARGVNAAPRNIDRQASRKSSVGFSGLYRKNDFQTAVAAVGAVLAVQSARAARRSTRRFPHR